MEIILLDSLIKTINKNVQEHYHKHNIYFYQEKEEYLHEVYFNLVKELMSKYKMSKKICPYILTSGPRKGYDCGASIKDDNDFCKRHCKIYEDEIDNKNLRKTEKPKKILDNEDEPVKKVIRKKILDDDEEEVKKSVKKKILDDDKK